MPLDSPPVSVVPRIATLILFLQATGNQMGDDFAVGRRAEDVAFGFESLLERAKIFDHAVMSDRQDLLPAEMRMGVVVGRGAVRGPAGVADADRAGGRVIGQLGFEQVDPAGRFDEGEFALRRDCDDARAIVAAIFEPSKSFQQKLDCGPMADITDDATHSWLLLLYRPPQLESTSL